MLTIFEQIQSMWNTDLEATLRGTIVSGTLPCRYQLIYTHVRSASSISKNHKVISLFVLKISFELLIAQLYGWDIMQFSYFRENQYVTWL